MSIEKNDTKNVYKDQSYGSAKQTKVAAVSR